MAYFRCGGGEIQQTSGGKVLLANNPTVTITKPSNNSATMTWAKPTTNGAAIAKYQVYKYKTSKPTSLDEMTLVGSTTDLTYTVSDLEIPSTYYFVVTTVTDKDYENAYIGGIVSIHFTNRVFIMRTNKGIFTSSDLIDWIDVTDRLRLSGSTTIPDIAYCTDSELFYTNGDVFMSKDGYNWEYKILPTVATPDGGTTYAYKFGVKKHDYRPVLTIDAPSSTNFFFLDDYEKGTYNSFDTTLRPRPSSRIWLMAGNPWYFTSESQTSNAEINGSSSNIYGCFFDVFSYYNSSDGYIEYVITNAEYGGIIKVYKRLAYKSSSFGEVYSVGSTSASGRYDLKGFAVKPVQQSNKDILIFSIIDGLYYSFDSGESWSSNYSDTADMTLTYDSAEDKFVGCHHVSSSQTDIYECDATEEAITGMQWEKVSTLTDVGTVNYIIGK